ncbi:hypothetical protein CMQ_4293 [Grosmannia clavigera kw1407]|uniref:Uncharacterized protein n=1 Tax=Grosmannia clavigera (strain kw1407 / UAMH 11150) TaxID=655863 RepID=F0XUC3_GROCL|nr:uncharacterized protein CMQ_4293 [Grosmannia clavigera kw1407]EFW98441.1 hypothetical protein CMQ_4293 [Grosmannia clavigera kw1407]
MACYSNPEVEALRWQLARFFPQLAVQNDTSRQPISDSPRAAAVAADRNGRRNALRTDAVQSLNFQTSMWNAYHTTYTSEDNQGRPGPNPHHQARIGSGRQTQKERRLRQLYTEYKSLISQSGRNDTSQDPVMSKVMHHAASDPDKAIEMLQQALNSSRLVEVLAYSQRLGQWRRTWQEKRHQRLAELLNRNGPQKQPATAQGEQASKSGMKAAPSQTLVMPPLPPPLPPCLQCVLANTCCSLTTSPYAQAFANDRTGVEGAAKRLSLRDEYAKLVAEHQGGKTAGSLAQKKRELDRKLLLRAVVVGDCESPFLSEPPAQCRRCSRRGELGCLQQSKDLTGTADVLEDDAVWFASSGPPPESLLRQHCQTLLSKMRGLAAASDGGGDNDQKRRPLLEAVFCRDSATMSAIEVAAKAESLLGSIFRQRQTVEGPGQFGGRRTASLGAGSSSHIRGLTQYANTLRPGDAVLSHRSPFRAPQGKRPVQAAAPLEIALRLPRWSHVDVYAGRGVATAALSYDCNSGDGDGKADTGLSDSFVPTPYVLPGWLPRVKHSETKPSYGWHDYFLDVSEDRAAAEFQKQQDSEKRASKKRKAAKGKGDGTKKSQGHVEHPPLVDSGHDDCLEKDKEEDVCMAEEAAEDLQNQRSWRDEMFRTRMDECRARLTETRRRPSARDSSEARDSASPLSWVQVVELARDFGVQPEQLERFRERRRTDPGLDALCKRVAKMLR